MALPKLEHPRPLVRLMDRRAAAFTMVPCAVRDLKDGYCTAVFEAIARHFNESGEAWPSLATICEHTGWSKPHVRRTIDKLISAGILTKEERRTNGASQSNVYRITANVQGETTDTPPVTTDRGVGNHRQGGGKPQIPKLEPIELDTRKRESSPLPPGPDFDTEFWLRYPKGRSSKQDARKLWDRLPVEDRQAAVDAMPAFLAGRDWKQGYHQAAEIWLKRRRWDDPPEPWSEPTNGTGVHKNGRRGMTPDEIMAYVNGATDDQDGNRDDVIEARGNLVQ